MNSEKRDTQKFWLSLERPEECVEFEKPVELAELYDETLMPIELRRAHRENDEAVREAYGFPKDISEYEVVGRLFGLYHELISTSR